MQVPFRKPGKFGNVKQDPVMTEDKFFALKKNLEKLLKDRPPAAREVSRLAELGDFSENVEYQLAKGRLRNINNRILILENQLKNAEILSKPRQLDRVEVGHTVIVESNGSQKTYQILGSTQTDPQKGIISHNSPIGSVLLEHKVGDSVKVLLNGREVLYLIVSIL